jgi:hypothetical protein
LIRMRNGQIISDSAVSGAPDAAPVKEMARLD